MARGAPAWRGRVGRALAPRFLGSLAAGMSNQDIARELVVSLDTAKKHVSQVLGKLVAASRIEAVARARQLDLIL